MPRKQTHRYYEENCKLMFKRANVWSKRTGREANDMIGVCHTAFMECVKVFDKNRGAKFSSLLALKCNQHIIKYCKKNPVHELFEEQQLAGMIYQGEDQIISWLHLKGRLEDEVGDIGSVIISSLHEIIEVADSKGSKGLRTGTREVLRNKGYTNKEIGAAFRQIRAILQETTA